MDYFAVAHLDVERLLRDWRWLCPHPVSVVARNAFGDLFLRNDEGKILWLDVGIGRLTEIADSVASFRTLASSDNAREKWFAINHQAIAANRGLVPGPEQCIGFAIPLVFKESGYSENPYLADLYDHISFLGDLHRTIAALPEGAKVKLVVGREPNK